MVQPYGREYPFRDARRLLISRRVDSLVTRAVLHCSAYFNPITFRNFRNFATMVGFRR